MALLKEICEKIILIIITISILITFCATPASYAKLDLKDGDYYYSGTTKGTYTIKDGIFAWLLNSIGDIADWLLGIITMGIRMVFVGWTALIEKLLTWALETTSGVSMAGEEIDKGINSTDLTSITDSSNNLTVQAIVYNRVPAFNINFFDLEYDKTVSGTGQKYKCEKCGKNAEECASETGCSCDCNGNCSGCRAYITALSIDEENNPPIVLQIKKLVSMWYYIIRLIAIAAMLVALIIIGIKMAISTIASEKAVYKRMLVDWLVGVIILFFIHYIMIFVIYTNEKMVDIISESADTVNTVTLKQISDKDTPIEKTDSELEIDVYEAIRTRAYDAKLSNGLSGMIMYMTLVYFAIRYTLVYLKRYLTLIVLTLMGPAVGLTYALQKVLSGKSATMKTWLSEYIMNVIIQIVHALIYAIFISTALVLSLHSVAGMIVALIFMNYSLKAEALFRKIFKFGDGDSLLGHTAEAGSAEKMRQTLQTARGMYMGAKPLAKTMMNTPFAGAVKGIGKIAAAGGIAGASAGIKSVQSVLNDMKNTPEEAFEKDVEKEMDKNGQGCARKDNESDEQYEARRSLAEQAVLRRKPKYSQVTSSPMVSEKSAVELLTKGEESLKAKVAFALSDMKSATAGSEEYAEAKKRYETAMADYGAYKESIGIPETKDIVAGHIDNLLDIDNQFRFNRTDSGRVQISLANLNKLRIGVLGTTHKDSKTGQRISDKNGMYNRLSSSNLLGFTDADKKVFKEQVLNPIRNGFGGIASMFVGMGTLVAHPQMGMALLGAGTALTSKTFKKSANSKGYKGRYHFSRFSTPAIKNLQKEAFKRSQKELDSAVVDNVRQNHPKLYQGLKADFKKDAKLGWTTDRLEDLRNGGIAAVTAGTLGVVSGAGVAFAPVAIAGTAGAAARFFKKHSGISVNEKKLNEHFVRQARTMQQTFLKDSANLQMGVAQGETIAAQERKQAEYEKQVYAEMGYEYDEIRREWVKKADSLEEYNKVMIALYAEQGLIYDPKTGTTTKIEEDDESSKTDIAEGEYVLTLADGTDSKLSDRKNQELVNRELDAIIKEMLDSSKGLDTESQAVQSEVIKRLSAKLEAAGIIQKDEKVEEIFDKGKAGIVDILKRKTSSIESQSKARNTSILEFLENSDKVAIQQAVESVAGQKPDYSQVKTEDVLSKLEGLRTGSLNPNQDGTRRADILPDGTRRPNTSKDGSQSANSSRDGAIKLADLDKSQFEQSIQTYLLSLKNNDIKRPSIEAVTSKDKKIAAARIAKRKKKLQQVLELNIDGLTDGTVEEAIDAVQSGTATVENETLTEQESSDVLELLLMRKELEDINNFARVELELKSGNIGYTGKVKAKSSAAVAYYGDKIAVETFKNSGKKQEELITSLESERRRLQASGKSSQEIEALLSDRARLNVDAYEEHLKVTQPELRREEVQDRLSQLISAQDKEMSLDKKEKAMKKAERVLDVKGPIDDVDRFIQGLRN